MNDVIQIQYPLIPVAPSNFGILEDNYLKGGFRVVNTQSDLLNIDATTIKLGMLALCEDSHVIWRASSVVYYTDEYGDPFATVDWKIFQFEAQAVIPKPNFSIQHANLTVSLENVGDKKSFEFEHDLGCYSFFLMNLAVNIPVQLQIFNNSTYKDINPYTFRAKYNHLADNGYSLVLRKGFTDTFNLKTSAYNIIINKDSPLSTKFYFRIKKDSKLTEFKTYDNNELIINFDYVTIET